MPPKSPSKTPIRKILVRRHGRRGGVPRRFQHFQNTSRIDKNIFAHSARGKIPLKSPLKSPLKTTSTEIKPKKEVKHMMFQISPNKNFRFKYLNTREKAKMQFFDYVETWNRLFPLSQAKTDEDVYKNIKRFKDHARHKNMTNLEFFSFFQNGFETVPRKLAWKWLFLTYMDATKDGTRVDNPIKITDQRKYIIGNFMESLRDMDKWFPEYQVKEEDLETTKNC
jgi:hypothetical protein